MAALGIRRRSSLLFSSLLLLGVTLVSPASAAGEGSPEELEYWVWTDPVTGIQDIFLKADMAGQVGVLAFGRGIAELGDTGSAVTADGGVVEWRKVRDRLDAGRNRHLAYRQHYLPPDLPPETAALGYGHEGIWLGGAALSLTLGADGKLLWVIGAQHLDVKATTSVNLTTPDKAFDAAQAGAAGWPGYEVGDPAEWPPGVLESYLERAELALTCRGPGDFAYVWEVPTRDARQRPALITLDAESGQVLDVVRTTPWSQCAPSLWSWETALAYPENNQFTPDDRPGMTATAGSAYMPGFTHEAHRDPQEYFIPDIQVFFGRDLELCEPNGHYEMVPLKEVYGPGYIMPAYLDYSASSPLFDFVPGRAAGDAVFFTFLTMDTIADVASYAFCGFDGGFSGDPQVGCTVPPDPARIVVDVWGCSSSELNNAFYNHLGGESSPAQAVAVCPKDCDPDNDGHVEFPFRPTAALDVVAHEWGHAVIENGALVHYGGLLEKFFHEGYADVIAYMVEGLVQPWGPGYEEADWVYSEDHYEPQPNDDRPRRTPELPYDGTEELWSLHQEETCHQYKPAYNYCNGSRLVEVFYLLTGGNDGVNPICDTHPTYAGCSQSANPVVVTPLHGDFDIAFQMASRVLFHALVFGDCAGITWSAWDKDDWLVPVGARVKASAKALYGDQAEASVGQAFAAIGFPIAKRAQ